MVVINLRLALAGVTQMVGTMSCTPKGCIFVSQLGCVSEATDGCFSPSLKISEGRKIESKPQTVPQSSAIVDSDSFACFPDVSVGTGALGAVHYVMFTVSTCSLLWGLSYHMIRYVLFLEYNDDICI